MAKASVLVPVISPTKDHRIIITPRYKNYKEALEFINKINYEVAGNLRSGKFPKAYPVDPFYQHFAEAAFMTGMDKVEDLCLDIGIGDLRDDRARDRDLQFFANYIKVSKGYTTTYSNFGTMVCGATSFFSHPDEFAQRHITGSRIIKGTTVL